MVMYRAKAGGQVALSPAEEAMVVADQFSAAKLSKLSELTAAYEAEIHSDITHAGRVWKADQKSQAVLAQVLSVGSVPATMYWRDSLDVQNSMTLADLQGLASAILQRALVADTKLVTKITAVNAAANQAEVDAVSY